MLQNRIDLPDILRARGHLKRANQNQVFLSVELTMFRVCLKYLIRKNERFLQFKHRIWVLNFHIWDFQDRTRKNFMKNNVVKVSS